MTTPFSYPFVTTPFRYTQPPPPRSATGRTAEVYAQLSEDFGIDDAVTFVVLSSAPELLAATWALMRESLLAGDGSRTGKELAALGVSRANRCPFCVDAHTVLLHATGDHALAERLARGGTPDKEVQARMLAWGEATRVPGHPDLTPLPFFARHTAAYVGTALSFHFINRIVSALLTENLLPGNAQRFRPVRSLAGRSLAKTLRRRLTPGTSLALLDGDPGPGPSWAAGTTVGPGLRGTADGRHGGWRPADRGRPGPRTKRRRGVGRHASAVGVGRPAGPEEQARGTAGDTGRAGSVPDHRRGCGGVEAAAVHGPLSGPARRVRRVRRRGPHRAGNAPRCPDFARGHGPSRVSPCHHTGTERVCTTAPQAGM